VVAAGLGPPELTEDRPHLDQGSLARFPDRGQRRAQPVHRRVTVQQVQGRSGLHGDRGHAVRHRVVQFPGDAQAFLRDHPGRLGGAFLFGQPEPDRGLVRQGLPAADHLAHRDGQRQDHGLGQELLEQRGQMGTASSAPSR